jgi:capsule polysaccharide export protein KpsE/RkpR
LHLGNTTDMADIQELTSMDQATPEELTEIIAELEKYRERLVNDTLSMAQRAKVMKAQALAHLEPNLAQIDAQLQALRQRQAALTTGN